MEDLTKIGLPVLIGYSIYSLYKYLSGSKNSEREYQSYRPSNDYYYYDRYKYEKASYTYPTTSSSSTSSHISDQPSTRNDYYYHDQYKYEKASYTYPITSSSSTSSHISDQPSTVWLDNIKEKQSSNTLNYNNIAKLPTSSAKAYIDYNTKENQSPTTLNYNVRSDTVKLPTSSANCNRSETYYSKNNIKEHNFNSLLLENTVSFQNAISKWNKSNLLKCTLNIINCNTVEYQNVITAFKKSCKNFDVISLSRVQNIYLLSKYLLKKEELKSRYKGDFNERVLYHGTKSTCINTILNTNFDWRLHGTNVGHRFGQGISFSPNARYCIEYCDSFKKGKIIVCNVLMGPICNGSPEIVVPPVYQQSKNRAPVYYDATIKPKKRDVIVKYYDDEFYPAYVIEFSYNKSKNKSVSIHTNGY